MVTGTVTNKNMLFIIACQDSIRVQACFQFFDQPSVGWIINGNSAHSGGSCFGISIGYPQGTPALSFVLSIAMGPAQLVTYRYPLAFVTP
jgi:hypothetical protein